MNKPRNLQQPIKPAGMKIAETHGANVYDLMQVFFIAAEKANPLTPENVAAEMHKVCGYQGLQGVMHMSPRKVKAWQ